MAPGAPARPPPSGWARRACDRCPGRPAGGDRRRLHDNSSVAVDSYFETSRSGIFAVGDVHGDIKLVVVAWAEGIQAAIYAFKEITSPFWLHEKRLRDQKINLIGDKLAEAARARKSS